MPTQRISASSYSNTAPLIWSFLYGSMRGKFEMILDTSPARSAELLAENSVDAALVPVIAYQKIPNVRLIPNVCVGARKKVRSVCLVTKGIDLKDVKSVSLDVSSKTSVVLTKIIFREFLGFEPKWTDNKPDIHKMLSDADCALMIGDPALSISNSHHDSQIRKFDLVELWQKFTGFGFVFAMWMTQNSFCDIDFAKARDEGLKHVKEIIANYEGEISLTHEEFEKYLLETVSYSIDDSMQKGLELYFELAFINNLIEKNLPLNFAS